MSLIALFMTLNKRSEVEIYHFILLFSQQHRFKLSLSRYYLMYGELLHNNIQVLRYNYWCRCRTLLNIYDKTFWENGKLATIFTKELHHKDVKGTLNIYNFFYWRMMNRIYTITCYHRQIYILLILDTSNNHSARIIKDRSYLVDMFTSMRWNVFCSYTSIRRLNKILYLRIFHVA